MWLAGGVQSRRVPLDQSIASMTESAEIAFGICPVLHRVMVLLASTTNNSTTAVGDAATTRIRVLLQLRDL